MRLFSAGCVDVFNSIFINNSRFRLFTYNSRFNKCFLDPIRFFLSPFNIPTTHAVARRPLPLPRVNGHGRKWRSKTKIFSFSSPLNIPTTHAVGRRPRPLLPDVWKLKFLSFFASQYPHYTRGWGLSRNNGHGRPPNRVRSGDIERRQKERNLIFPTSFSSVTIYTRQW